MLQFADIIVLMPTSERAARERYRKQIALSTMPKQLSKEMKQLWLHMTESQRVMAMMLAKGGTSITEAFRIAYGKDPQDRKQSTYIEASRTAQNPKVALMAEALIGTFNDAGYSNPAKTRQSVLAKLAELTVDGSVSPAVQMNAAVWLGKAAHVKLFTEDRAGQEPATEDVREALRAALAEMFAPAAPATPEAPAVITVDAITVTVEPEPSGPPAAHEPTDPDDSKDVA